MGSRRHEDGGNHDDDAVDDVGLIDRGDKLQGIVDGLQRREGKEASTSAGVAMHSGKKSAIAALERLIDERVEMCLAQRDRRVSALVEAVERLNTILCTSRANGRSGAAPKELETGEEKGEEEAGGEDGGHSATTHRIDALVRVVERMATHMQVLDEAVRSKLLGLDLADDNEGGDRIHERV